jgi:hypothetical protein
MESENALGARKATKAKDITKPKVKRFMSHLLLKSINRFFL